MSLTKSDWEILDKFKFKSPPVSVKYLVRPTGRIPKLDEDRALCEMLKAAFDGNSFYAEARNHTCEAGSYVMGQTELEEPYRNGEFGAGMDVFGDKRAAARLYHYIPRIEMGEVNYVAFSPYKQLILNPDVLIILADPDQAEILLRAMSYRTGKMWQSRYSSAIGCAWLFIYPYLSGEINFIATGLGFGMKRRKLFPEGMQLISIPFDQIPSILKTLSEMPWIPRPFQTDGPEYAKQLRAKLGLPRSP
jgi:uncharacterized protein (DUF169 family)